MKACIYSLLAVASVLAMGCQRNAHMKAYIDLLGVEQRLLEDDYYAVETERRYLSSEVKQLQKENGVLRKRLGIAPTDPVVTTPAETVPGSSAPESSTPSLELETPEIEIPDAPRELPGGNRLPSETAPAETLPGPGGAAMKTPVEEKPYTPPEDLRVTHVVINPVLTTGHNFDRRPGDDGISVVIEPRNADDEFVPRAGDVSIALLDPAAEGEAQRVARWDFPLDEATHRIRTDKFGRGLVFKLPWPDDPPQRTRLHVFVRYTSDDGREMQADQPIEIAEQGEYSNRWTPKSVQPISDHGDESSVGVEHKQIPLELPSPAKSSSGSVLIRSEPSNAPRSSTTPEVIPAPRAPQWSPNRP